MDLEKNVVRAPIPHRSSDRQSHYNPENSYFVKIGSVYDKVKTEIAKRFGRKIVAREDLYKDL